VIGFYKGYTVEKIIAIKDAEARLYKLAFPIFTEVLGMPLDLEYFIALVVGMILLVIVMLIIIFEYITWRRARLEKAWREKFWY